MRLTSRGHLGILALVELARVDGNELSTVELAKRTGGSARFLEATMRELHIAGIVRSRKGRYGGYRLAQPAELITVGAISRVLDGPPAPAPCGDPHSPDGCNWCPQSPCLLRDLMQDVAQAVTSVLEGQTIWDLASRPEPTAHRDTRHLAESFNGKAALVTRAVV